MRLVTFDKGDGHERVGRLDGDDVVELDVPSTRDYLERTGTGQSVAETGARRCGGDLDRCSVLGGACYYRRARGAFAVGRKAIPRRSDPAIDGRRVRTWCGSGVPAHTGGVLRRSWDRGQDGGAPGLGSACLPDRPGPGLTSGRARRPSSRDETWQSPLVER